MNLGPEVHVGRVVADELLCRKLGSADRPISELHVTGQVTTHSLGSVSAPVRTIHMASDFVIQDDLKFVAASSGAEVARIGTDGRVTASAVTVGGYDALTTASSVVQFDVQNAVIDGTNIHNLFETEPGKVHVYLGISDWLGDYQSLHPQDKLRAKTSLVSSNWILQKEEMIQTINDEKYMLVDNAYTKTESDARYVQPTALTQYLTQTAANNDFLGIDAIASKFTLQNPVTIGGTQLVAPHTVETSAGTAVNVVTDFTSWGNDFTGNDEARAKTSLVTPQWVLDKDLAIQSANDTRYGSMATQNAIDTRLSAIENHISPNNSLVIEAVKEVEFRTGGVARLVVDNDGVYKDIRRKLAID